MAERKRAPWRCRHGRHRYRFVSMSDRRMGPTLPWAPAWVCDVTEQCVRCLIVRTMPGVDVPTNPKVEYVHD